MTESLRIITDSMCRMTTHDEFINGDENWLICNCGNEPHMDGFFSCLEDGAITSPEIGGNWGELLYVCIRCGRIINAYSRQVMGVASEDVKQANADFDWANY